MAYLKPTLQSHVQMRKKVKSIQQKLMCLITAGGGVYTKACLKKMKMVNMCGGGRLFSKTEDGAVSRGQLMKGGNRTISHAKVHRS